MNTANLRKPLVNFNNSKKVCFSSPHPSVLFLWRNRFLEVLLHCHWYCSNSGIFNFSSNNNDKIPTKPDSGNMEFTYATALFGERTIYSFHCLSKFIFRISGFILFSFRFQDIIQMHNIIKFENLKLLLYW